ncbi:MAG: DUF3224 domain-containing protein [Candidatus Sulfotelmatobacter sp.]
MKIHLSPRVVLAVLFLCLALGSSVFVQTQSATPSQKEAIMPNHATGPFDVKVTPQDDKSEDATLGRMTLDKQYHGDLEAIGKGQMLTAGTANKGSGGYVAIEKVTGTLHGRTGSFVLQHSGTMTGGVPQLTITVVPESGSGQLEGIAGKMTIKIAPTGKHTYDFEYTLPTHL